MKSIRNSKGLYWGLIIAFFVLYMCVGFVSTLHSITFFEIANATWMAVLLGITYEVGQASVLFSILMSDNHKKFLPWALMILLTALQVTANVYASFKFMDGSGTLDWQFWQRSILFMMEGDAEMFKVVISWITGALLPVVALGMTALVAENLKMKDEQENVDNGLIEKEETVELQGELSDDVEIIEEVVHDKPQEHTKNVKFAEELLEEPIQTKPEKIEANIVKKPFEIPIKTLDDVKPIIADVSNNEEADYVKRAQENMPAYKKLIDKVVTNKEIPAGPPKSVKFEKKPVNNIRGWHLKKEFIDDNGDVYHYGVHSPDERGAPPKKA